MTRHGSVVDLHAICLAPTHEDANAGEIQTVSHKAQSACELSPSP